MNAFYFTLIYVVQTLFAIPLNENLNEIVIKSDLTDIEKIFEPNVFETDNDGVYVYASNIEIFPQSETVNKAITTSEFKDSDEANVKSDIFQGSHNEVNIEYKNNNITKSEYFHEDTFKNMKNNNSYVGQVFETNSESEMVIPSPIESTASEVKVSTTTTTTQSPPLESAATRDSTTTTTPYRALTANDINLHDNNTFKFKFEEKINENARNNESIQENQFAFTKSPNLIPQTTTSQQVLDETTTSKASEILQRFERVTIMRNEIQKDDGNKQNDKPNTENDVQTNPTISDSNKEINNEALTTNKALFLNTSSQSSKVSDDSNNQNLGKLTDHQTALINKTSEKEINTPKISNKKNKQSISKRLKELEIMFDKEMSNDDSVTHSRNKRGVINKNEINENIYSPVKQQQSESKHEKISYYDKLTYSKNIVNDNIRIEQTPVTDTKENEGKSVKLTKRNAVEHVAHIIRLHPFITLLIWLGSCIFSWMVGFFVHDYCTIRLKRLCGSCKKSKSENKIKEDES